MIKIVNGHKSEGIARDSFWTDCGLFGVQQLEALAVEVFRGERTQCDIQLFANEIFWSSQQEHIGEWMPKPKTDPSKNLSLKSQSLFKVGLCFCFFIINIRYLLNEQRTFCVVACKQITGKKWSKKAKLVDVAICVIIELFDRSQMDWRETESSWWVRVWRASIWTLFASTCTDWSWEHFFYMKWKRGNEFRKKFSFISGNWIQFK